MRSDSETFPRERLERAVALRERQHSGDRAGRLLRVAHSRSASSEAESAQATCRLDDALV